jgi:hypothetical protein
MNETAQLQGGGGGLKGMNGGVSKYIVLDTVL